MTICVLYSLDFAVIIRIKNLCRMNGERSLAKPVVRARLSDSEDSDGEGVLRDVEEEEEFVLKQHLYLSNVTCAPKRTYEFGSTLPFTRDGTREFK